MKSLLEVNSQSLFTSGKKNAEDLKKRKANEKKTRLYICTKFPKIKF